MNKDKDWVAERVNETRKAYPAVSDSSATRIVELVKGKVMDRQLSTTELQEIAKILLADIEPPASPKTDIADAD